jgi:hypothetical protein
MDSESSNLIFETIVLSEKGEKTGLEVTDLDVSNGLKMVVVGSELRQFRVEGVVLLLKTRELCCEHIEHMVQFVDYSIDFGNALTGH